MHAFDRRTNRQTDRQTDGQTEFPSLYRDCIPCSAVINRLIDWLIDKHTSGQTPVKHILDGGNWILGNSSVPVPQICNLELIIFISFAIAWRFSLKLPVSTFLFLTRACAEWTASLLPEWIQCSYLRRFVRNQDDLLIGLFNLQLPKV